ncbi:hypothetical protein Tco_0427367 [Tanacetum coccineum]
MEGVEVCAWFDGVGVGYNGGSLVFGWWYGGFADVVDLVVDVMYGRVIVVVVGLRGEWVDREVTRINLGIGCDVFTGSRADGERIDLVVSVIGGLYTGVLGFSGVCVAELGGCVVTLEYVWYGYWEDRCGLMLFSTLRDMISS